MRGILLDARAGVGAYSWMQEQGWGHTSGCKSRGGGILLDARAGEGHTPGCKSREGSIILDVRAGVGVYSWMHEQLRGYTPGCKSS